MHLHLRKPAPLFLAAFYAVLAAFGHGLHTHGSCVGGSHNERQREVAKPGCVCGHDHCLSAASLTANDNEPAGGFHRPGQSVCHDCAACAVMAQMSVGYDNAEPPQLVKRPAITERFSVGSFPASITVGLAEARGPPALRG